MKRTKIEKDDWFMIILLTLFIGIVLYLNEASKDCEKITYNYWICPKVSDQ